MEEARHPVVKQASASSDVTNHRDAVTHCPVVLTRGQASRRRRGIYRRAAVGGRPASAGVSAACVWAPPTRRLASQRKRAAWTTYGRRRYEHGSASSPTGSLPEGGRADPFPVCPKYPRRVMARAGSLWISQRCRRHLPVWQRLGSPSCGRTGA